MNMVEEEYFDANSRFPHEIDETVAKVKDLKTLPIAGKMDEFSMS